MIIPLNTIREIALQLASIYAARPKDYGGFFK